MKKTVLVDVDGVLAQYDGWKGLEHFGDPIHGAVEFTKKLSEKYEVCIFTTRAHAPSNKSEVEKNLTKLGFGGPGATAIESGEAHLSDEDAQKVLNSLLVQWLDKHGFHYDRIEGKPICVAIVDDRAIECLPQQHENPEEAFADALNILR